MKQAIKFNIDFKPGILLSLSLVILTPLLEVSLARIFNINYCVEDIQSLPMYFTIIIIEFLGSILLIEIWSKTSIISAIFTNLPSKKEAIKWSLIGASFGILPFIRMIYSGIKLYTIDALLLFISEVTSSSLILPLVEEITYRGLMFNVLARKNRFWAYVGTAAVFVLSHSKSYSDIIFKGDIGLSPIQIFTLTIFSLVASRIFESTEKISLCWLFHASANVMHDFGILTGMLLQ